jgi:cytochrome c peroxidase
MRSAMVTMRTLVMAVAVWPALTAGSAPAALASEPPVTPEEMAILRTFAMGPMPADPTNRWADDPRAAALGQQFFFDTRFSGPLGPDNDGVSSGSLGRPGQWGRVACASCHDPSKGGSDHRTTANTSLAAGWTGRNAPSVLNAAYSPVWQFWDGRKDSLWSHALGPPESPVEHNGTRLQFAHVIYDHYRNEYEAIFGQLPELTDLGRFPASGKPGDASFDRMAPADQTAINRVYSNFGKAIAAYERTLLSRNSAFDRFLAGQDSALSSAAVRGMKLFIGRASCNECHRGPNFTDYQFHNVGAPQVGPHLPETDTGRADGIAKVLGDPFNRAGQFSDHPESAHLQGLAVSPADIGAFKTPGLRSVSRTAPYMHDGVYPTLWDVLQHYRFGGSTGKFAGVKSPAIQPLSLSDHDLNDLIEFLEALDGEPLPNALVTAPPLP